MLKYRGLIALLLFTLLLGGACSRSIDPAQLKEELLQFGIENKEQNIDIETQMGTIKLKLYADVPLHRANFLKMVKGGYYDDNATFYRVISGFMIQGGNPGRQAPNYLIPAEFTPKYFHKKGALAMARYDEGNPEKKSSPSEFFIVQGHVYDEAELLQEAESLGVKLTPEQIKAYTTVGGYLSLDQQYTVFGEVTQGLDVMDKIAAQQTYEDKPLQKIRFSIKAED